MTQAASRCLADSDDGVRVSSTSPRTPATVPVGRLVAQVEVDVVGLGLDGQLGGRGDEQRVDLGVDVLQHRLSELAGRQLAAVQLGGDGVVARDAGQPLGEQPGPG